MLQNLPCVAIAACLAALCFPPAQAETVPPTAPRSGSGSEEAQGQPGQYSELLDHLTAEDPRARAEAWANVVQHRRTTISVLQSIAERPEFASEKDDLQWRAVEALAQLRATAAGGVLMARLCVRHPWMRSSEDSPFDNYPAAQAILDVGEPAIQGLFSRLGHAVGEEELKLIAYVFWHHYAPQDEQDVGLYRLKHRLKQIQTRRAESAKVTGRSMPPSRREKNLARLIEIYQQITPHDPADWPKP